MRINSWIAFALLFAVFASPATAQERYEGPIIDMHVHAYTADGNGPPGMPMCAGRSAPDNWDGITPWPKFLTEFMMRNSCATSISGSLTDDALRDETIAVMREYNVKGLLGGSAARVANWSAAAPDLFWPARHLNPVRDPDLTPEALAAAWDAGDIHAIAEITSQYSGIMIDDPRMEPYWEMAEERGIPVGVHIGPGPPGTTALYPDYRVQNPMRVANVLDKFPRLRLFVMHAGYPFDDEMKALFWAYPGLMAEVGVLSWAYPPAEFHGFLRSLTEAGYAGRIMFGSDQMNWPGTIGHGIEMIQQADYLSLAQKRAILHDNAAMFLRLDQNGTPNAR